MNDSGANEKNAVRPAELHWDDHGQPRSADYDDVYFSREDGLAESRYVFLEHNDLPRRFAALDAGDRFVIGETGFGTGLNVLAAWDLWRATAPADATLHLLSAEAFPLRRDDLARALNAFPELADLANRLLAAYPACLAPGMHRLVLDEGRVSLTLLIAEVAEALSELLESAHPAHRVPRRGVDAWFLDGFAPSRNPAMWRPEVLSLVRELSAEGATVATFTAVGAVRRGLRGIGFDMVKAPGFGHKRDMLHGRLAHPAQTPEVGAFEASPFPDGHEHAWQVQRDTPRHPEGAIVVGGGLAGCHAAAALARRGIPVTLLEAEDDLARGGSGNRQGVVYGRLSAHASPAADFNLAALLFAQRHFAPYWCDPDGRFGEACGVLHLDAPGAANSQEKLLRRLGDQGLCQLLEPADAGEIAGLDLPAGGLWFPDSGWLSPSALCAGLVDHTGIEVRRARVQRLDREGDRWIPRDAEGASLGSAPVLILACATALSAIDPGLALPVQPVRGQVSALDLARAPSAGDLRIALCGEGYVTPAVDGAVHFGASFVPGDSGTDVREAEHAENLQRLRRQAPGLVPDDVDPAHCSGRAGIRCATPDRLPMVGPVPDADAMTQRFALLGKNARAAVAASGAFQPGLFVSAGYGSRGLAYIPLCTELLMADVLNEPPPVTRDLRRALSPARFVVRDLVRGSSATR